MQPRAQLQNVLEVKIKGALARQPLLDFQFISISFRTSSNIYSLLPRYIIIHHEGETNHHKGVC